MEFNIFLTLIFLFFIGIASLIDLFTLHVPDLISYSFIILSLITRIGMSIYYMDASILISSFMAGIVLFMIGWLFYMLRIWGGADSKILTGVGIVFGWNIELFVYLFIFAIVSLLWKTVIVLLSSVFNLFNKKKSRTLFVPLVPAFFISFVILLIFG